MDVINLKIDNKLNEIDKLIDRDKYSIIIVGEFHDQKITSKLYNTIIKQFKPEYFICEFIGTDKCLTKDELGNRINNISYDKNDIKLGVRCVKGINDHLYKLAYNNNCKLIGCDNFDYLGNNIIAQSANTSFSLREEYMLDIIRQYEEKICLIQLGDLHMRSTPYYDEDIKKFNLPKHNYLKNEEIRHPSIIYEYFKDRKDVLLIRLTNLCDIEKEMSDC